MLVDYEYRNGQLITSYINEHGNIKLKYFPWANPTKYVVTSEDDAEKSERFTTWDGKAIKEVYTRYPNRYSVYNFLENLPEEEKKTIFDYQEPEIFFIDIETEIVGEFVQPHKATSEIQTISIVNKDKVMVLGTKKISKEEIKTIKDGVNNHFSKFKTNYDFMYKHYETEYDMLLNFFKLMIPKMAVLTGWNFIHYDWVFLVNRARRLGIDPSYSSFTRVLKEAYDPRDFSEIPAHRIVVDYMELYEKWDQSIKVKESSSLDFVSEKLLNLKKIHYEGNLKYLYESDYTKFVLYNAIDSALVQQIHYKMKYVDIMYGIATLSRIKATDAFSTLPVTEGILKDKLRDEKNILFVKDTTKEKEAMSVKGGWVKDPVVGMNSWTCCYDFASLYPTTIQELNISADSYRGKLNMIKGKTIYEMISMLRDGAEIYSTFNGYKIKLDQDDIITLNGAVFKNEDGVVKKVMADIYAQRKKYKKQMMAANEEYKDMEKQLEALNAKGYSITDDRAHKQEIRDLEAKMTKTKADKDYFKAMQLALKLVINGTYGAFANAHFVASNADIANSITAHGRDVNQHCMNRIEKHFYEKWHLNKDMHRKLGMEYIGINKDGKYQAFDVDLQPIAWGVKELKDLFKMKDITIDLLKENKFEKDGIQVLYEYHICDFSDVQALDSNPQWTTLDGRDKYDGDDKKQIIIYGDTDSLYFSYTPVMRSVGFDKMNDMRWGRRFILHMDAIYTKPLIGEILQEYANIFGVKNLHDFELETISKSALFLKKKHYLNNIVWEDFVFYNDLEYFYPKGVEIIRSSTPPFVRERIYDVINYLFSNVDNININNILKIVKKVRKDFENSHIEDISMTSSCSKYDEKVLDDTVTLDTVKGAHFGVKASAFHNYLLNKNSEFKTKYDAVKSGRIKYYYCNHPVSNVFAYLRSFHPNEVVENEGVKIDMDTQFEKSFLGIVNKFIKPLGMPEINKRLSVLTSLFNF